MPSAAVIAEEVAAGRVRAVEVLAACAARHRDAGTRLNALVQPRWTEAAAEAAAIDAAPRGGLAGVPVCVKECFAVRGLRTTLGIGPRLDERDDDDATAVARLRAAGAIIVGKTNVPQAMYLHETDNPVWGRTLHPLAADRSPGGSSGGDAALVAAGIVPLGLGNDLAGSLRQPAHACGIAALMPRTAVFGDGGGFDTMPQLRVVRPRAGFLAAEVGDLRLALRQVAATAPPRRPAAPLAIGWWDDAGPIPASPAVTRGVAEAVEGLRRAGATVTRLDAAIAGEAAWLHLAILAADGGAQVRALYRGSRPMPGVGRLLRIAGVPRTLRRFVAAAARLTGRGLESQALVATGPRHGREFERLVEARAMLAERYAALVAGLDAIVCPVSALPALRHGTAARLILAAAPCLLANLLDLPAGTVPVTTVRPDEERGRGRSHDPVLRDAVLTDRDSRGLPVGVQVVGGPTADESVVLDVMQAIAGGVTIPAGP